MTLTWGLLRDSIELSAIAGFYLVIFSKIIVAEGFALNLRSNIFLLNSPVLCVVYKA